MVKTYTKLGVLLMALLCCGQAWGAIRLVATIGVITDLHHDQESDEISTNLSALLAMYYSEAGVTNYLGLGDLIDTSAGDSGPFADNVADLVAAFSGKTIKSVTGNHDLSGSTDFYETASAIYPSDYFTWDLGTKWRVIALSANDAPGYAITDAKLSWLETQLTQAASDGRYVLFATHQQVYASRTPSAAVLTPAAVTGSGISVTTATADTFTSGDVGKVLFLRHGTCTDTSCWGWGTVASFVGGTEVTINISNNFVNTSAADEWGFLYEEQTIYNSAAVRTKLEAAGASVVKLCVNGHSHANGTATVNSIEYRQFESLAVNRSDPAQTGGIVYLYDDGTWKIQGSRGQTSYNWLNCYVSATLGSSAGGKLLNDPYQTIAQAQTGCNVAGTTIRVLPGTYAGNWTVAMNAATAESPITWTFDSGAIFSGFSDAGTIGDAWSAGVDGNGWYTKTGVTTEPKVLTEDGTMLYEGVYSGAAVAGKWDWNANTLYYLPTTGAPGSHTVKISQVNTGINCYGTSSNCDYMVFNGATFEGFSTAGFNLQNSTHSTWNDTESYHNGYGLTISAPGTLNGIYTHDNMNAGVYSNGTSGSAAATVNFLRSINNGHIATCGDYCSGFVVWNHDYTPNLNNAVLAYNYNGIRSYMNTAGLHVGTYSNVITYGNTNRGVYFNGALNPSHTVQYSIINDTATWGNATHSTGILTSDPLFVDPAASGGNFRLRPGSPAIDAGTPVFTAAAYPGDAAGNMYVYGSAPDIGAYEMPQFNQGPPILHSLGLFLFGDPILYKAP